MSILGQKIPVNGVDLNVYVEGDGEPVLLLHPTLTVATHMEAEIADTTGTCRRAARGACI